MPAPLSPYVLDLSNNDPIFDSVIYRHSGHVAVALKTSEGIGFKDPDHKRMALAAGSQHIAVLHYHFADTNSAGHRPEDECAFFLKCVGDLAGPHDYMVLDQERATPQGWSGDPAWSKRFDKYLREHSRFAGMILYGSRSNLQIAAADKWFHAPPYRVWDADWSSGMDAGPAGSTVVMRQFTDGVFGPLPHALPGGPSSADVNIMRGSFMRDVFLNSK